MPVVNEQQELFFRSSGNWYTKLRRFLKKRSSLKSRLKQCGWLLVANNQKKIYGEGHEPDITV